MNRKIIFTVFFAMIMVFAAMVNGVETMPFLKVMEPSQWDVDKVQSYITNQEPDPAEPGGYVEVRFKVENFGGGTAKDVIYQLMPAFPFSLEPGDSATRAVGEIHTEQVGDNAVVLYYKLRVDENAVPGDNEIRLMYSINGESWTTLKPFNIRIQAHDVSLGIDSVESEPQVIKPGEKAKVTVRVRNLADADIKNLKISLQMLRAVQTATSLTYIELPFSPVGSSNEKTIGKLEAKRTAFVEFEIVADATATAGVHKVPMVISYQDKLGKNYSVTQITSLEVGEVPDFIVSLDENEIHQKGQLGEVTVKFVNKGSSQVRFVYATLKASESYTLISSSDVYIGNIDSDDYNTALFKMYIKDGKGSINIPLHYEYRDSRNNLYLKDVNLTLPIYTQEQVNNLGLQPKSNSWMYLFLIVIAVAGFFIYRRWKKHRKKKQ